MRPRESDARDADRPGDPPSWRSTADSAPDPSFDARNPTAPPTRMTFRGAPITAALIIGMIAIELYASLDFLHRANLIGLFAFRPITIIGVAEDALPPQDLLTTISYAFLHGNLMHLAFNMLGLAVLGPPVERALGAVSYVLGYLALCIAGALGQLAWEWTAITVLFEGRDARNLLIPLVGASGAVFGVLGLDLGRRAMALAAMPERFRPMAPGAYLVRASAAIVIINVVLMLANLPISGAAHLGGFVLGLLLAPLLFRPGGARRL